MDAEEIAKIQAYLRKTFSNNQFAVKMPAKPSHPVEVYIGPQFIGNIDRDEDDGEVSYYLTVTILEDDLDEV